MAVRIDRMNVVQLMLRAYALQARLNRMPQAEYEQAAAQQLVATQARLCDRYQLLTGRALF